MYALFLLFGLGCDEGKIYPDETVDSGRTATVSLSFTGLKAWAEGEYALVMRFWRG